MESTLSETLLWLRTSGLRVMIILIGGMALVRLFHAAADRILRLMADGEGPTFSECEKRARTLAGLLRTLGTTLVVILAVMMVLREIGLDITPLLAGAGVVGLAIGFGAQSLIKDGIQTPYPHRVVITRSNS